MLDQCINSRFQFLQHWAYKQFMLLGERPTLDVNFLQWLQGFSQLCLMWTLKYQLQCQVNMCINIHYCYLFYYLLYMISASFINMLSSAMELYLVCNIIPSTKLIMHTLLMASIQNTIHGTNSAINYKREVVCWSTMNVQLITTDCGWWIKIQHLFPSTLLSSTQKLY